MRTRRPHSDSRQHMLSTRGLFRNDSQQHMRSTRRSILKNVHPSTTQRQPPTHAFNQGAISKQAPPSSTQRQLTTRASNQGDCFEKCILVDHVATADNTSFQPGGRSLKNALQVDPTATANNTCCMLPTRRGCTVPENALSSTPQRQPMLPRRPHSDSQQRMLSEGGAVLKDAPPSRTQRQPTTRAFNQDGSIFKKARPPSGHSDCQQHTLPTQGGISENAPPIESTASAGKTR